MFGLKNVAPIGDLLEEVSFNLLAAATREGVTVDARDWYGSSQADFSDNRKSGFPLLDLIIRPPGNANVNVQYGLPTFPIAEPPVLAFSTFQTLAAPALTWTPLALRVTARFWRVQVVDTSGAANNGIYLAYFVRGA